MLKIKTRGYKMRKYLIVALLLLVATIGFTEDSRSPKWPSVRAAFLKSNNGANAVCAICGWGPGAQSFNSRLLNVHHVKPFSKDPKLELDPTNFITLCESKYPGFNCHLEVGHSGSFRLENPWIREDAAKLHDMFLKYKGYTVLPKEMEDYLAFIKQRVKKYNCDMYQYRCNK